MALVLERQRELLHLLWRNGPLSRSELHEQTGIRPNTVGSDVDVLVQLGVLREGDARRDGPGRPRVPVTIDAEQLGVLGLSLRPGQVSLARMNLQGETPGEAEVRDAEGAQMLVQTAAGLLRQHADDKTFAIGLSTTGFVDQARHAVLFSSATKDSHGVSLEPVYNAVNGRTIVLGNDMHALAAQWLLQQHANLTEDVLIIGIDDGQMGGAVLVEGRPNKGCVSAGNEIGHTRLPVDTERCYCGEVGCLERICSTRFLQSMEGSAKSLLERASAFDETDAGMSEMIDLLATGISNSINLLRVHRLVIVSELAGMPRFAARLQEAVRSKLLIELAGRVQFELWDYAPFRAAQTAGWLALAAIYCHGWDPSAT